MPIGEKEWVARYEGHTIRVVNTWFAGAKLYIDGECRDTSNAQVQTDKTRPILSARLDGKAIEVYVVSVFTTKAKICVEGQQVGGDVF